jgi:hypothetical protein
MRATVITRIRKQTNSTKNSKLSLDVDDVSEWGVTPDTMFTWQHLRRKPYQDVQIAPLVLSWGTYHKISIIDSLNQPDAHRCMQHGNTS